jgi:hypothetical protein
MVDTVKKISEKNIFLKNYILKIFLNENINIW